jgi:hypothetical protein
MKRSGIIFVAAAAAAAMSACGRPAPVTTSGTGTGSPSPQTGLVAFETVRGVLQHARCQNCHPAGDVPLQGDDSHPHPQNIQRGADGKGMIGARCTTCHGPGNPPDSYGRNVPPGASTGWRMPKPEEKLVFVGVSPRALCEHVRDPAHNGGMDAAKLRHHLDDPLVTWGWNPGFGRTPIPVPREAFLDAFTTWMNAGMPCPE